MTGKASMSISSKIILIFIIYNHSYKHAIALNKESPFRLPPALHSFFSSFTYLPPPGPVSPEAPLPPAPPDIGWQF